MGQRRLASFRSRSPWFVQHQPGASTHKDGLRDVLLRAPSRGLLVAIDGLIWVNDQQGHVKGDRVLALVANFLTQATTGTSTVFRVGGDEFLIVLSGVDLPATLREAARIVLGVRSLQIPF